VRPGDELRFDVLRDNQPLTITGVWMHSVCAVFYFESELVPIYNRDIESYLNRFAVIFYFYVAYFSVKAPTASQQTK
jgi:hypothetical protein